VRMSSRSIKKQPPAHRKAIFIGFKELCGLLAALAEIQNLCECGESDEEIDDRFYGRPCAENHVDDVQIASEETPETDQSPVQGTNHDEDKADLAAFAAAGGATTHKKKGEKE